MSTNDAVGIPQYLTPEDGESIKEALIEAIRRSSDPSLHKLAAEVVSATPFIDPGGTLYLKSWRLDKQKGRLVKRQLGVSAGPIFEADVSKQDGKWFVGDITVGRMLRPR